MRSSTPVTTAALLGVATVLAACAGSPAVGTQSAGAGSAGPSGRYRVWVDSAGASGASGLTVIDPSGHVVRSLPDGVPAADWSRIYRATADPHGTLVTAVDTATGRTVGSLHLPYSVSMPTMDGGGNPAPLTPGGRALVLSGQVRNAAGAVVESTFAVVGRTLAAAPALIRLPGIWRADGISADASNLFLIEDLTATAVRSYHVRLFDVATGQLDPTVIVAKGDDPNAPMNGVGVARVFLGGGTWQLTLYADGPKGAFIHALNLDNSNPRNFQAAFCLDLEGTPRTGHEGYWSLLAGPNGSAIAVNGAAGSIATVRLSGGGGPSVDLSANAVVPAAVLGTAASTACCAPLNAAAALSANGRTVYAAAPAGVVVFDLNTVSLRGIAGVGLHPRSLATTPDGALVVADAVTGVSVLDLEGGGPSRLLGASAGPATMVARVEAMAG